MTLENAYHQLVRDETKESLAAHVCARLEEIAVLTHRMKELEKEYIEALWIIHKAGIPWAEPKLRMRGEINEGINCTQPEE